jgi:KaiC/GvpD/RAD55 family RecA-like ATPase
MQGEMNWLRALKTREPAIPLPWDIKVEPRKGQLFILLGPPAVGKSLFALNWLLYLARNGEHSVLISLDTDLATQSERALSILSGFPARLTKVLPVEWFRGYTRLLERCSVYDVNVRTDEINEIVMAETDYWGEPPAVVVVDNLANIVPNVDYGAYRKCIIDLLHIARRHKSLVLVLHHVQKGVELPTLHSGQFAGEQDAEVVLGLSRMTDSLLRLSVLKNRNGKADPGGSVCSTIALNHENLRMSTWATS